MAWMHTPIFSSTCAGEETACVERRQASRQTKDATRRFDWFDPFRRFESNFLRFAFRFPRLPDSVGFVAPALWRWWPLTGTRAAPTSRSGRSRSAPSSRRWEADRKSASVQTLVIDKHGNSKRHIETLGCIAISSSIQQRPMQPVKQSLLLHLNQKMPNVANFCPCFPNGPINREKHHASSPASASRSNRIYAQYEMMFRLQASKSNNWYKQCFPAPRQQNGHFPGAKDSFLGNHTAVLSGTKERCALALRVPLGVEIEFYLLQY